MRGRRWLWRLTWGASLVVALVAGIAWLGCLYGAGVTGVRVANVSVLVSVHGGFLDAALLKPGVRVRTSLYRVNRGSLWSPRVPTPTARSMTFLGMRYTPRDPGLGRHVVQMPLIYLVIAALILPATAWWKCVSNGREENPLCANCGYDLRASTDACPECGEPIRSESASV